MAKPMLDGDETPSDGIPEAHKTFASMGLDEPDDEVFEEDDFGTSRSFHSRLDHTPLHPVDLKVRKEISDTGYRGYVAATPLAPSATDVSIEEILHKTILVGDSGVGKTSLLVQFDTGTFHPSSFAATVGIGFTNKVLVVDGAKVKLQIWDTAGQERFRSVTHAYYRDAHALFLLYDVTNRKSFDNTRAWLAEINEYAHRDVIIMLLGNKCDSEDRVVNREDGERLGREYKVNFMETSAKTGLNVDVAFTEVARALRDKRTTVSASYGVQEYVEPRQWSQNVCSACNTS
ncbi:ras-related protein Rab-37-like isoform X1 [Daphnia carinata]|uniref:ras-related protein Rab-37-like isoform X1 n=1 Tax=Daphnia carinata TaxID=120202 RepID=UPI00257C52BD|nr:ras-related protein Rab-37-like isoform X1 [Daphnia carinata]